jgi:hypothetical protein
LDDNAEIGFSSRTPNLSKSSQASPSASQILPKKKAWISLDRLGGNEPFEEVAPTP